MIALVLGTVLALTALAYVLAPLFADNVPAWPAAGVVEAKTSPVQGFAICAVCGPRPESDALYCSTCGRWLGEPCANCGAVLDQPGARFCPACGHGVDGAV